MATDRNVITTGRLGHPVNNYYIKKFLSRRMPNMVFTMFGMPYTLPAHEGDTVSWDRFANPTAQTTPLVEAEDPSPVLQSRTTIQSTVSRYGAWMKCSSWMQITAPNSYSAQKTEWLSDQHAITMDTVCRNTIVGTASSTTCSNGSPTATMINSTDTLTVTENILRQEGRQITSAVNAGTGQGTSPTMPGFIMIADTDLRNDFYADPGFLKFSQYGSGGPQYPGEEGRLEDCVVILTTNGYLSGATYSNVVISQEAYGNVRLPADDEMLIHLSPREVGSPLLSYSTYGWKGVYAARILNDNWIHVLNCTRGAR